MELSLILATDLCPNLRQVTEPLCFCGPLFHKVKVRSDITRQRLTQCIRTYLKLMWEAAAKTVTLVDVLFLTSKMKLLPVCLASPGTQMCTQTQGSCEQARGPAQGWPHPPCRLPPESGLYIQGPLLRLPSPFTVRLRQPCSGTFFRQQLRLRLLGQRCPGLAPKVG